MSGYRMWRLAIVIPLLLIKLAFYSSRSSDDYTPPDYYIPPPAYAHIPDPTPPPEPAAPVHVPQALQVEDGDAPDLATAKGDFAPVVAIAGAFDPKGDGAFPHVMLGDSAAIGIALADPSVIVGARWLATWKLSPAQALAIATANLRQEHVQFVQVEPGVWSTPDSDTIGASRILLVDEIKKLHLAGGAVAMIPNRSTVLLAGAKDARALLAMASRASDLASTANPIHTIPLCLDGSTWKECVPHVTDEVKETLGDLAVEGRRAVYADVRDAYQDKLGDDLFVAHLSSMDDAGETYATWTKTVPTMLPKADWVAFVVLVGPDGEEKGKMLGLAPWSRVMQVCGAHLKDTGRLPKYWATGDWFPSDAELKQLALKPQ